MNLPKNKINHIANFHDSVFISCVLPSEALGVMSLVSSQISVVTSTAMIIFIVFSLQIILMDI